MENTKFIEFQNSCEQKHWDEWVLGSAICPEITSLNLISLQGNEAYDLLLYSDKLPRTNTGCLSFSVLNRYKHISDGGWWAGNVFSDWGCFKPDNPIFDEEKEKFRKYHHPEKEATELFILKIPVAIWQLIGLRYNVDLPENYRDVKDNPRIFWEWVMQNPQLPIVLTEGVKKTAAILSRGYIAIGAPGIYNFYRTPKNEFGEVCGERFLIGKILPFCAKDRHFYLCFDQDEKKRTIRTVNQALTNLSWLLTNTRCKVSFISWKPGLGKGIDDYLVRFKTEEKRQEAFSELYRKAVNFKDWQSLQLRRLTYKPDMIINCARIGEVTPPSSAQFICIKSGKGTGKTHLFSEITQPLLQTGERRILLITHRIQLGTQTSNRMGIPHVMEVKSLEEGSHFGLALCIDSLRPDSSAKFKYEEWSGAWLFIDEIQQLIWHLLTSSTCAKDRVKIIKNLQQLMQYILATGGKIFTADADLNDITIDFVEGLLGFSPERFLLVNEYQAEENSWNVYKFDGKNPAKLIAELERQLASGKRVFLSLTGQKAKSKWGTQVLEQHFRKLFPHLRIIRCDSETVANPKHPAFGCTAEVNEVFANYDLVLASPTIETGVSIDLVGHFDSVFYIGQGVQTCDGVRQNLSRVREPVDRYIWLVKKGINKIGNGSTNPKGLINSQKRLDRANRNKLIEAGFATMPENGNFSPICLETWAKQGAIINMGMNNYEQTILDDLRAEGHTIINWEEKDKQVKSPDKVEAEVIDIKNNVYNNYCDGVSDAKKLTPIEKEKLDRQPQKTLSEIYQLRKAHIEEKYQIECNPELVKKDDNGWYEKIKLYYYWADGRKYLEFKDKRTFEKVIKNGQGDYFIVDNNRSLLQLKVALLEYLEIERLYQSSGFHNNHPVIINIFDKIKRHVFEIKEIAGIDLRKLVKKEKNRTQAVKEILKLLGLKMVCYARKGKRGQQIRYYSSPAPDFYKIENREERRSKKTKYHLDSNGLPIPKSDGRSEVIARWLERDTQAVQKTQLAQTEASIDGRQLATSGSVPEEVLHTVGIAPQTHAHGAQSAAEEQIWQPHLEAIAQDLQSCEDSQTFKLVATCYPINVIKNAITSLTSAFQEKLNRWLEQLTADKTSFSHISI